MFCRSAAQQTHKGVAVDIWARAGQGSSLSVFLWSALLLALLAVGGRTGSRQCFSKLQKGDRQRTKLFFIIIPVRILAASSRHVADFLSAGAESQGGGTVIHAHALRQLEQSHTPQQTPPQRLTGMPLAQHRQGLNQSGDTTDSTQQTPPLQYNMDTTDTKVTTLTQRSHTQRPYQGGGARPCTRPAHPPRSRTNRWDSCKVHRE